MLTGHSGKVLGMGAQHPIRVKIDQKNIVRVEFVAGHTAYQQLDANTHSETGISCFKTTVKHTALPNHLHHPREMVVTSENTSWHVTVIRGQAARPMRKTHTLKGKFKMSSQMPDSLRDLLRWRDWLAARICRLRVPDF